MRKRKSTRFGFPNVVNHAMERLARDVQSVERESQLAGFECLEIARGLRILILSNAVTIGSLDVV
jgi:hypothetical protein